MSGEFPGEMRIGERLEAARIRASLDLATVEERTKIRQRYLRALERLREILSAMPGGLEP